MHLQKSSLNAVFFFTLYDLNRQKHETVPFRPDSSTFPQQSSLKIRVFAVFTSKRQKNGLFIRKYFKKQLCFYLPVAFFVIIRLIYMLVFSYNK